MSASAALALLGAEAGLAFPGAVLGYGDQGRARLLAAVGDAGLDTWFDLASLTKALCTSILSMRLVSAGRLRLEEEARRPAPAGWALPGVTVAQLLCHASGLPAWRPLYEKAGASMRGKSAAARGVVIAAAARAADGAQGPAGARSVYSDLGFILLGDLLEHRGEGRLDELLSPVLSALGAEVAFRPIAAAAPVAASACAETRSEGARARLQGVVHDDNARAMGGVAGHAGLFGTVRGVAVIAAALLAAYHGEATPLGISKEVLRRFFASCGVPGSTWGLGWDHPDPTPSRSSAGERWSRTGVGHLGFTGCSLWLDPLARRWAILLSNRAAAVTEEAAEDSKARLKALRPRVHDALLTL